MRKPRNLNVESLENRHLMAVDVVEVEPNNRERNATPFQLPGTEIVRLVGTSRSHDDKDYFTFVAPESGELQIDVAANRRIQLELSRPGDVDVFETEPNDGINGGSVHVEAGQRYFVRLRAVGRAATYQASLSLNGSTTTPDPDPTPDPAESVLTETESNNRKSSANRFALDTLGAAELRGTTTERDKDFFVFTTPRAGTIQISSLGSTARSVQIEVEDTQSRERMETEPNDGITSGSFTVAANETLFVRVRGKVAGSTDYRVSVQLTAATSSTANDVASTASSDVRREDRRHDRRVDRREDHQEDRREDRRVDRRENRRVDTTADLLDSSSSTAASDAVFAELGRDDRGRARRRSSR